MTHQWAAGNLWAICPMCPGVGEGRDTEETMDGKVLIVLIGPRGAFYIIVNNSSNKESNLMNGDGALVHVPSF